MLVPRTSASTAVELLEGFRLVILGGARQTGKSTLVRDLIGLPSESRMSLDDESILRRAREDPTGFVDALAAPTAIDEFQRAGLPLLLAVKRRVDLDDRRGQLLLTGSANYLADRSVSETLAGRAGRLVLWPFSAGERRGIRETFVDHLFDPAAWPPLPSASPARSDLAAEILSGGFPEVVSQGMTGRRRRAWFDAYVHDVVSREALRPMAEVRRENELRDVLRLVAARTAGELVVSDIANDSGLARATASEYLGLLEALYLIVRLPAWSTNLTNRVKQRAKVVVLDTGLAADLIGASESDFGPHADGRIAGALFETWVVTEICKQTGWSDRAVDLHHFRDRRGAEIDLVVTDRRSGAIAGVEIKLTATPTERHTRTLAAFRDHYGDRFTVGLLVHAGEHSLPMGERLWAVPVSALWRSDLI